MPAWASPTEALVSNAAATPSDGVVCPSPDPGFLSVATHPWTEVLVDEVAVGTTPLFRHPLPAGKHRIQFINAELGVERAEEIVLEQAELRKLKFVFLTEKRESRELDSSMDAAPRTEEDCLATDSLRAWMSVDTHPWARVFLDGRSIGTTPLFRHPVAPGGHALRLVRSDGVAFHTRIRAEAGESIKLVVDPAPPSGRREGAPAHQDRGL